MTREDLIDFCLMFTASYEDYPFNNGKSQKVLQRQRHLESY
jgi:hypothetical protein